MSARERVNWQVCRRTSPPLVYPDYIALIIRNSDYPSIIGSFLQKKNKNKNIRWKEKEGRLSPKKIDSPASGAKWDTSRRQMLTLE